MFDFYIGYQSVTIKFNYFCSEKHAIITEVEAAFDGYYYFSDFRSFIHNPSL